MSVLTKPNLKGITESELREKGFYKSPWGAPHGRYKNGKCKWDATRQCWDFYVKYSRYLGCITYFPKDFDGYVVPAVQQKINPAGYAMITIDHSPKFEDMYVFMPVANIEGINMAIDFLNAKMNEL